MIALGSDHGGLALKEALKQLLTERGLAAEGCGTLNSDSVDRATASHSRSACAGTNRSARAVRADSCAARSRTWA